MFFYKSIQNESKYTKCWNYIKYLFHKLEIMQQKSICGKTMEYNFKMYIFEQRGVKHTGWRGALNEGKRKQKFLFESKIF